MWYLSVLFCLVLNRSAAFIDLKLPDFPHQYKIRGSRGSDLEVEVKDGTKSCQLIQNSRKVETSQPTVPVLKPHITLGRGPRQKEVLNITWISAPDIITRKHPKAYLLQLAKTHEGQTSTSCIVLRFRNRKRVKTENKLTLFYDFIELVPEDETYLVVQLWYLPGRRTVNRSEVYGSTRHMRSMSFSKTCREILGQIQCSVKEKVPLSLDSHTSSICHCSKPPTARIDRLPNGSLQVSVRNLPQYAYNVEVLIQDKDRGYKVVFSTNMKGTKRANENRLMVTNMTFGPGHYIAVVHAMCSRKNDHLIVGNKCSFTGRVQSNNTLEVSNQTTDNAGSEFYRPALLGGILGGIAFAGTVTVAVFYWTKYGRKRNQNGLQIEMAPINSRIRSRRASLSIEETKPLTIYSRADSDLFKADQYQREDYTASSSAVKARPTQVSLTISSRDSKTTTSLIAETPRLRETNLEVLRNTPIRVLRNTSRVVSHSQWVSDIKPEKMLLYHPDDQWHVDIVKELRHLLRDRFGIHLLTDNTDNWRDFAESVGERFTDLVIILSPGLLELCKAYEDKTCGRSEFEKLLQKRKYRYTPCVAMKKLQSLIQHNPHTCQINLQFVLFYPDSSLLDEFLNIYSFLQRGSTYFICDLHVRENAFRQSRLMVRRYKDNLRELVLRLKGVTENDTQWDEIGRAHV